MHLDLLGEVLANVLVVGYVVFGLFISWYLLGLRYSLLLRNGWLL